jgi:ribosomal protein S18 acetylase RimI-like enzyme
MYSGYWTSNLFIAYQMLALFGNNRLGMIRAFFLQLCLQNSNSMNNINVRQAVLSDIEALIPLFDDYRQFYGRPSDIRAVREFLLARFNHGESVLFIAHEGNTPVGFTQLYPSFSSVSLARTFVLNDLFVLEQARRKGVASKLMSAATEFANLLGAVRVSLSTASTNQTAQALYQSAGWNRDEKFFVYHFEF